MKSLTKILLAAVLLTSTCFAFAKTNAPADVVDRHLSGFNSIDVAGSFDVDIVQGASESVKVEAPANVMDHIITEVSGGVLKIYNKHDNSWNWNLFGHKKIVIYVTAKDLNSIVLSGSGDCFFRDGISANALKLKISGSGDMNGKLTAKSVECSISGSGDMKLSGRAESSTVSIVGSGDFTGRGLVTVNTTVRVTGSGDAGINASGRIDAAVHGSGDIHYTGGAKTVNKSKSGSGDISGF